MEIRLKLDDPGLLDDKLEPEELGEEYCKTEPIWSRYAGE
jgi:hypothetical protein